MGSVDNKRKNSPPTVMMMEGDDVIGLKLPGQKARERKKKAAVGAAERERAQKIEALKKKKQELARHSRVFGSLPFKEPDVFRLKNAQERSGFMAWLQNYAPLQAYTLINYTHTVPHLFPIAPITTAEARKRFPDIMNHYPTLTVAGSSTKPEKRRFSYEDKITHEKRGPEDKFLIFQLNDPTKALQQRYYMRIDPKFIDMGVLLLSGKGEVARPLIWGLRDKFIDRVGEKAGQKQRLDRDPLGLQLFTQYANTQLGTRRLQEGNAKLLEAWLKNRQARLPQTERGRQPLDRLLSATTTTMRAGNSIAIQEKNEEKEYTQQLLELLLALNVELYNRLQQESERALQRGAAGITLPDFVIEGGEGKQGEALERQQQQLKALKRLYQDWRA